MKQDAERNETQLKRIPVLLSAKQFRLGGNLMNVIVLKMNVYCTLRMSLFPVLIAFALR